MRRIGATVFLTLFLLVFVPFLTVHAEYTPDFAVNAEAVYMVNLDTEAVLYQKNAAKQVYPASLTKIMTTILALENTADLDGTIVRCGGTVWDEFKGMNISNAGIIPGEDRTMRDLVYCMMLPSANEAASIVASYVGGSRSDFTAMMNKKAQEIGAVNTNFVNPHGLHSPDHYTTALDMYLLTRYAMKLPGFMDIASTNTYTLEASNKRGTQYIRTTNRMQVQGSDSYYPYVKGIKTGTTEEAGRCFISTATKNGYTYLIVMLGAPYGTAADGYNENAAFTESRKLYDWAFNNFVVKDLLNNEQPTTEVPLKLNWDKDYLYLRPESSFSALVPANAGEDDVIQRIIIPSFINAPVKKGDVIGSVELMVMGEKVGSVRLLADEDAERSDILYILEVVKASTKSVWFYVGLVAFVLLLMLMILGSIVSSRSRGPKFNGRR